MFAAAAVCASIAVLASIAVRFVRGIMIVRRSTYAANDGNHHQSGDHTRRRADTHRTQPQNELDG
jgi:hypothetical protein